jgi:hypothetical protein
MKIEFSLQILEKYSYFRFNENCISRTTICTDCTTPLFYILAPTCFGISLPSSGSLLDPTELLEIQIRWVVYHNVLLRDLCHRSRNHTLYDIPVLQVT